MAYTKTVWSTGDTITASLANHWETQYDEVKAEVEKTDGSSDIKPHWSNIGGKPASFTPNAHKSTHATGGSDELTPTDIGAETPAGAQAKAEAAAGVVQADLNSHKADTASHNATSAATANRIIVRDAYGRAKVAAPAASDDIARKAEVDVKVTGPASVVDGNITVFNGTTGKLVKDSGKKTSDFMSSSKINGNVAYTDSIPANNSLTKSIPLGGEYKHGIAVLFASSTGVDIHGVVIFFGTDPQKTLVAGFYEGGTSDGGSAWSKRATGYVTGSTGYNAGFAAAGNGSIKTEDFYINGSNLQIVFRNMDGSNPKNLNCSIDWEVW